MTSNVRARATNFLTRRRWVALAAGAGAAVLGATGAPAQTARTVRVIAFPGGGNGWPIWLAQKYGYFAQEGLAVELTPTSGSVYQMTHLLAGDFDIAHTAADNAIAYSEGQGEVQVPPESSLVVVMGGDNGFLHVLGRPQLKRYADLRGKRLGVDAVTTGFAFVLRKMLEVNGLAAGDYELLPVGAGARRYQALVEGSIDATISSTPFDILGRAAGLRDLGAAIDTLGHYQGYAAVTTRQFALTNPALLESYIRAYRRALTRLYDPTFKSEAIALLSEQGKLTPATAEASYTALVDRRRGYDPQAAIDPAGMQTVIDLRRSYGPSRAPLGPPEKYLALTAYQSAVP